MKRSVLMALAAVGLCLTLGSSAQAFSTRTGENVTLPVSSRVTGSLYATGTKLDINGDVTGDLFCAGQQVTVRGNVGGDIICAASSITIAGTVGGNLRLAAGTVELPGSISRNASILAGTLTQPKDGKIDGELMSQTQSTTLSGSIAGDAYGSAATVVLNGAVGGRTRYEATKVSVGPLAHLTSGLDYTSREKAQIATGAVITGPPHQSLPPAGPSASERLHNHLINWILSLGTALLIALLLTRLIPGLAKFAGETLRTHVGQTSLRGLAAIILTPFVAVVLILSLVGAPVGVILFILWGITLYLARVIVAVGCGRLLERRFFDDDGQTHPYREAVVGVIVLWLLFLIPVLGSLVTVLAVIIGVGIIAAKLLFHHSSPRPIETAPKQLN